MSQNIEPVVRMLVEERMQRQQMVGLVVGGLGIALGIIGMVVAIQARGDAQRMRAAVEPLTTLVKPDAKGGVRVERLVVTADGAEATYLRPGRVTLTRLDANRVILTTHDDEGPAVMVCDEKGGVRSCLGSNHLTDSERGGHETTPEDNLVLFKPDGKVLLRLPLR